MHRFFVAKEQIPIITGTDVHHIKDVLRMKAGDKLELLDGTGKIYRAKIAEIKKDRVICHIIESRTQKTESGARVTIAQCLPKAKKMDLIIQKCTELGVHRIIPTLSERSIAKAEKIERWKKIAKEASEQSGRASIPEISPLTRFEDVLKLKHQYDLALIPWELEKSTTLKKVLTTPPSSFGLRRTSHQPNHLLVVIGPEGGFSREEIELARKAGFKSISLGKTILRTETAGMAIMAMLAYEFD
jgi:16S rRNA (uracil1498-N3)-methyltransferase